MHHQQIIKIECHSVAYLICKIGPNKQFLLDYLRVKKSPELLLDSIYPLQKTKYKGFQISSSPDTSRRWGLVWNTLSYARKRFIEILIVLIVDYEKSFRDFVNHNF